jgi:glucan phosphoethanolaminetransferase (alkaline phosphatase superfamily)
MFILGSSIQPAILLIVGLLALKFSNKSNFMNEPDNIKKWYIITTVSIYICIFCSFSSISYVYYIPLGGPKIIHSLVCFLISALVITFLIYLKRSMESRLLRWGISIFSILYLCYGTFLSFVFIYALPDNSSQPAFGAFVFASSVALIIFQLIWYRKKMS